MLNKIKILHVLSALNSGGVESMIKNYYEKVNNTFEFEFIVHESKIGMIEKELLQKSCSVYHVIPKKSSIFRNFLQIYKIINKNNYDVVHCHQDLLSFNAMIAAFLNHVKTRIIHIHRSIEHYSFLDKIFRKISILFANGYFTCDNKTGVDFYGKKICESNNYYIMNNAIEFNKFKYDERKRKELRKKYHLENKKILLVVGRLIKSKNCDFALKILDKLKSDNFFLVFIGDGDYKEQIISSINKMSLSNNIIILPPTNCINDFYSMADILLFPSYSEGFGMVAIEAQINGLPVIASKNIPRTTNIGNIEYEEYSINKWLNIIKRAKRKEINKDECAEYNIDIQSERYKKSILRMIGD